MWPDDPFGTYPTGTPPPIHSIAYHVKTGTHFITFYEPDLPTTSTATTSHSRPYYSDHHLIQAQSHSSGSTCTTVHSPISPANNPRLMASHAQILTGTPMHYTAINFTAPYSPHNGHAVSASPDFPPSMYFHGFSPTTAQPITRPGL